MRFSTKRRLRIVVLLAAAGIAVWYFWSRPDPKPQQTETQTDQARPYAPIEAVSTIAPPADQPTPDEQVDRPQAVAMLRRGMQFRAAGRLIKARDAISKALLTGRLDPQAAQQARAAAAELADKTILSRQVLPDDPYCYYYPVKFGDMLAKLAGDQDLRVPYELIMRINGIADAKQLQAGHRLKLIRGPFHAVISKSRYTIDIYLHRPGLPKLFIKRMRVGLGKNGSTPLGSWRVADGEKLHRPVWYPAPNSAYKGEVRPSDPDYAFGAVALWIGLEGTDENTRMLPDYGLHSTNKPGSIGRDESEGCIRLADDDIELLFALLAEIHSTVQTVP